VAYVFQPTWLRIARKQPCATLVTLWRVRRVPGHMQSEREANLFLSRPD